MTVTQRIFDLMAEKRITIAELSKLTGISQSTISTWKQRNSCPPSDKLSSIAMALETSVSNLLGVDETINVNSPTIAMHGNSFAQGYVNNTISSDVFSNPEVTAAYNSLSATEKLEIQIEILKKAESKNGEK